MSDRIQKLVETIGRGSREDVWEAAKELAEVSADLVLELVHILKNGMDTNNRAAAAYALGFGRLADSRIALEDVLTTQAEVAGVRGHAAEALGYLEDRRSLDVLIQSLSDKEPAVVYWCTFALGQIGDSSALPALNDLVQRAGTQLYETHSLKDEALDAIGAIRRSARISPTDE